MTRGLEPSAPRCPKRRGISAAKGGALVLLALSMTTGAGTRALAAAARPATPRPTRAASAPSQSRDPAAPESVVAAPTDASPQASTPVTSAVASAADSGSIYDRIWSYAKPWDNPANRWLQELSIVGREQFEFEHFHSHQGDSDDFTNRRTRLGLKAKVLKTLTLHSEVDLNLEGEGEVYNRLTDSYVRWSPDKRFNLTVGKQGVKFTLDGSISSTQLVTMDRSNLTNNFWFPEEYLPGVGVSGDWNEWVYNAGWFSAGDANSEFGDFKGGSVVLVSGGYDFGDRLGIDKALTRLDFVWQDPDKQSDLTRPEREVVSLNFQGEKGRWGLAGDLDWSNGYGSQSDLVGGEIMPSVKFRDTWQAVLRYTGVASDDDNGVRLARYENRIVFGRGDEYHEIYLGLNKFFYGHKLKWQSGIQYAALHDSAGDGGSYRGWGVTTGIRISW